MANKELRKSNNPKPEKTPKKSRKRLYIGLAAFLSIVGLVIFVAFSISGAIQDAKVSLNKERGSSTSGQAKINTDEIKKANVDATVNVDPNSPIAKEARAREEEKRAEAIGKGESYMPRIRVKNQESDGAKDSEGKNGVETVDVDELGQEKVNPNANADSESDSSSSLESAEPNKDESGLGALNPLPDIDIDTPFDSVNDGYMSGDEKEIINKEIALKNLELEKQELAMRKAKRTANGKALYSGLEYVPPITGALVGALPTLNTDPYAQTDTISFSVGSPDTSVSLLVRNDGGKTRTDPHIAYLNRQNEQINTEKHATATQDRAAKEAQERNQLVKGGEAFIAQLTLPIDSDKPGPLRAEIKEGPFKGDIAMGNFVLIDNNEGIALQLTNIFHGEEVYSVETYALHPTTELPAFDDDVDHHYWVRFGALGAGLFISGFLESLVDVTIVNGSGGTTTEKSAISDTSDRIVYSIAKSAEGFLPIFYDMAARPIQVKVPKGQVFKVLFTNNVYEQTTSGEPAELPTIEQETTVQTTNDVVPNTRPLPTLAVETEGTDTLTLWK